VEDGPPDRRQPVEHGPPDRRQPVEHGPPDRRQPVEHGPPDRRQPVEHGPPDRHDVRHVSPTAPRPRRPAATPRPAGGPPDHPVMRSIGRGEARRWCYVDRVLG